MYHYTLTNESLVVIVKGDPITVQKGTINFEPLREVLLNEDWDKVESVLTIKGAVEVWSEGALVIEGETASFNGKELPPVLARRLVKMASAGEDLTPFTRFWERCQKHPKPESLVQLWAFLVHNGIPLTEDGCFLANKSVKSNFTDHHTGKINNELGAKIPRLKWEEVDTNPNNHCSRGYHVGSTGYTKKFGGVGSKHVVCKVAPEDVASVPNDHNASKLRCIYYEIVSHAGGALSNTTTKDAATTSITKPDPKTEKPDPKTKYSAKDWAGFEKLTEEELLTKPLDLIRGYAANEVRIAGASKIPGGKRALVARIMDVRGTNE